MIERFMNRLWVRLVGAFLLVVGVAVGLLAVTTSQAVERSFRGYLSREDTPDQLVERLEAHFANDDSWEGVQVLLPGPGGEGQGRGQGYGQGGGAIFSVISSNRYVIASTEPSMIDQAVSSSDLERAFPLTHNGQTVGYLLVTQPVQARLNEAQQAFLIEVRRSLASITLLAGGLALLLGLVFSQLLAHPLSRITTAAQDIASGALGRQVEVSATAPAELTALAGMFNKMSASLAEAEAIRRRLTADIAHELRTPLTVMRGQLQGMLDGVQPVNEAHVATVYEQTLHLSRLVEDLRTLSLAESGHLPLNIQPLDMTDLLHSTIDAFQLLAKDAGLTLGHDISARLPRINGDADRLRQVLGNLLINALRHTPQGGIIRLTAAHTEETVQIAVSNTGSTLTAEQAQHVFKRFWRVDESRQRDSGRTGLGLAIARQIIRLHDGEITVTVEDDKVRFTIEISAITP